MLFLRYHVSSKAFFFFFFNQSSEFSGTDALPGIGSILMDTGSWWVVYPVAFSFLFFSFDRVLSAISSTILRLCAWFKIPFRKSRSRSWSATRIDQCRTIRSLSFFEIHTCRTEPWRRIERWTFQVRGFPFCILFPIDV